MKRLTVANPHGFCSGVARAVATARKVLSDHQGEKVYCLHEIVHNGQVVSELTAAGMVFVQQVDDVPPGSVLLFSAHGVAPAVRKAAEARNLRVVDATCPFVAKVHATVREFASKGVYVFCIGHHGHDEVVGVAGEAPDFVRVVEDENDVRSVSVPDGSETAVVTQTTLSAEKVDRLIDALRRRYPALRVPGGTEICYATRNRQRAVRRLAEVCGNVLVLGAANSSNSRRLVETAQSAGANAALVSEMSDLDGSPLLDSARLGITSGASTPESFLDAVVNRLMCDYGFTGCDVLEC